MKRYLLFAGPCFYPNGGWQDLSASFDDLNAAKELAHKSFGGEDHWWHVVDTEIEGDWEQQIVAADWMENDD